MGAPGNPFSALGPPPASADPAAHLAYLKGLLDAFAQSTEPRIKPLKEKLESTLQSVARAVERGEATEVVATRFAKELTELRIAVYDLLLTVVNQVRATLRVQVPRSTPEAQRVKMDDLQQALGDFAQGLRKLVAALKKGDVAKQEEAIREVEKAGSSLDSSGHALEKAAQEGP